MKKLIYIVVLCFILSGCKNFNITSKAKPQVTPTPTSTAVGNDLTNYQRGGTLSLPIANFDTLNPILTKSKSVANAMKLVYEPLFMLNEKQEAVPVLASSFSEDTNALDYTIYLKNDITWHDGLPLTASDVDYTIKSILNSDSVYKASLANVATYKVIDQNTYLIKLNAPIVNFVSLLDFPIIKNGSSMKLNDKEYTSVGTGPYKYSTSIGVRSTTLISNASWHGTGVPAYIEQIMLKMLPDKNSASFSFEAREVEALTSDLVSMQSYSPKGNATIKEYTSNDMTFLGVNYYNSIFWGKNTRNALGYIIDKDKIVSNILLGHAVASDLPINPSSALYEGRKRAYSVDKTKAHELLKADGWAMSAESNTYSRTFNNVAQQLQLNLLVNNDNPMRVSMANNIATSLNEAGFRVTVVEVGFDEYVNRINSKQFDIFLGEVSFANNFDLDFLLSSKGNYFTYGNKDMDTALSTAKYAADKQSLKKAYEGIFNIFNDDSPFVVLYFSKNALMLDKKVNGKINPITNNPYNDIGLWYVKQ